MCLSCLCILRTAMSEWQCMLLSVLSLQFECVRNWPLGRQYYDGCYHTHTPLHCDCLLGCYSRKKNKIKSTQQIPPSYTLSLQRLRLKPDRRAHGRAPPPGTSANTRGTSAVLDRPLPWQSRQKYSVTHVSQHSSPLLSALAH